MTSDWLEECVARWVPRLGLTHWAIEFDWDRPVPPEENTEAMVERTDSYDVATMRFSAKYLTWTAAWAEWVVVHELIHLVTRDLEHAAEAAQELLPKKARKLAAAHFHHEVEGVIDRLAAVLLAVARA